MAESADVLAQPHQQVILPNMAAGCSMADMADPDDVIDAWEALVERIGAGGGNTRAGHSGDLHEFGRRSEGVLRRERWNRVHFIERRAGPCSGPSSGAERVLFFPDQHLGRNTGYKLGVALDQMVVWDPLLPLGGNSEERLRDSRIILWKGHCSVHKRFTVAQIEKARRDYPGINVIVHPECELPVVQAADLAGSTEFILARIAGRGAGHAMGGRHRIQHGAPAARPRIPTS